MSFSTRPCSFATFFNIILASLFLESGSDETAQKEQMCQELKPICAKPECEHRSEWAAHFLGMRHSLDAAKPKDCMISCSSSPTYSLSPIPIPTEWNFFTSYKPSRWQACRAARCGRIECASLVWSGDELHDLSPLEDLCSLNFFTWPKKKVCEGCDNPPVTSLLLTKHLVIIPLVSSI